jgi:hypothetical protein
MDLKKIFMYLETFVNLKNVREFKKCLIALKSVHEFVQVSENVCPFKKIAQLLSSKSVHKRGKCSSNLKKFVQKVFVREERVQKVFVREENYICSM